MAVRDIDYTKDLDHTLEQMARHGLLLTSVGTDGRPNAMTIGWAAAGFLWARPAFVVMVRPSRFTFGNIEATGEFVVSVPDEGLREAAAFCGTESGRDVDKFAECAFTAEPAGAVGPPLIAECVRHYECKVVHCNDVADAALDPALRASFYPGGDLHRLYYGRILRACERA